MGWLNTGERRPFWVLTEVLSETAKVESLPRDSCLAVLNQKILVAAGSQNLVLPGRRQHRDQH